ncbi:uncharacterized protein (UPF0548 family) [Rhodococcus sp. 27YEA15]|uniref:DUF1990 domain-containing protein n=1 Tax=Rhodococcus sp. 27YEA15 TaxID=3156259 RepID=UPI003C7C2E3D
MSDLSPAGLTYPDVGATAGALPSGYHHLHEVAVVGTGRADFEVAARVVMSWQMHRGAGLTLRSGPRTAIAGHDATLGFGPVRIPVRVVYEVNEVNRQGFAYGTRAGHPECGEESFVVRFDPATEQVSVEIVAFSKPGTWWVRLGTPVGRRVQRSMTRRYLDSVRDNVSRQGR